MNADELLRQASLEDRHWWYAERRAVLRRVLAAIPGKGSALDVGAAAGGNTTIIEQAGWRVLGCEYSEVAARIARARGLSVVQADALRLPLKTSTVSLVVAMDVLEHLDDRAALAEIRRVLQPGGTLFLSVPADPRLWSRHDDALGHLRRYTREGLQAVLEESRLTVGSVWSWNVLLRPAIALQRRGEDEGEDVSDLEMVAKPLNLMLRAVVASERFLTPLRSLPGVSLMAIAHRA